MARKSMKISRNTFGKRSRRGYGKRSRRESGKSSRRGSGKSSRRGSGKSSRKKYKIAKGFGDMMGKLSNFTTSLKLKKQIKQAKASEAEEWKHINYNKSNSPTGVIAFNNSNNSETMENHPIQGCPSQKKKPVQCNGDTMKERQKHYRRQTKIFHPDRNKGCPKDGESKFKELEACCKSDNVDEFLGTCGKSFATTDFVGEN